MPLGGDSRVYALYLDNLFTNVPLANAIGELSIVTDRLVITDYFRQVAYTDQSDVIDVTNEG